MIYLREYDCTGKWKHWIYISFVFPAERFSHTRGSKLHWYFFCVMWRPFLLNPYTATSVISKMAKLGKLTPDLFKLFCIENAKLDNSSVFSLFFLTVPLEYLDIVLSKIKVVSEISYLRSIQFALKETSLSELRV